MSDTTSHLLSNDFRAVRLIALHDEPELAGHHAGPFVVVQQGIDPEDPEMMVEDFLLTRRGTWMRLELVAQLSQEERQETACFPDAADVILLLEHLPSRPVVERPSAPGRRGPPAEETIHGSDSDAAILRALRGGALPAPQEDEAGHHTVGHYPGKRP